MQQARRWSRGQHVYGGSFSKGMLAGLSRGRSSCFFSSRRRHTRFDCDWSSDVCSSDLDFTLSARYGYRPVAFGFKFPDFFSAFVGLRLPIWAWRKQNRLADAARADSTGAAAGLRDAELQLSREVTEAAARVQASQRRLALLVDGVLPNARGTVESVLRSYQVGRAEFLTLLSVEDARFRA